MDLLLLFKQWRSYLKNLLGSDISDRSEKLGDIVQKVEKAHSHYAK